MIKRCAHFGPVIAETSSVINARACPSCRVSRSHSVVSQSVSRRSRAAIGVFSCGASGSLSGSMGRSSAGMLYSAKLLKRVLSEALPDPVKTVLKMTGSNQLRRTRPKNRAGEVEVVDVLGQRQLGDG